LDKLGVMATLYNTNITNNIIANNNQYLCYEYQNSASITANISKFSANSSWYLL